MRAPIPLALIALASAAPAFAQVAPYPPTSAWPGGAPAAIADQHRHEMERLRGQAEANAALARRQDQEARLRRLEIEAARRQADGAAPAPRPLYTPEQERGLRLGAAERRARTSEGLSQIDDYLNRPR